MTGAENVKVRYCPCGSEIPPGGASSIYCRECLLSNPYDCAMYAEHGACICSTGYPGSCVGTVRRG